MARIINGDYGTRISIDVNENVSAATVTRIYYKKPSGATGYWTATKDTENTDIIYYDTQSGNIDEAGIWEFQPYFEIGSWKGRGTVCKLLIDVKI
jgi:hypothetical protein